MSLGFKTRASLGLLAVAVVTLLMIARYHDFYHVGPAVDGPVPINKFQVLVTKDNRSVPFAPELYKLLKERKVYELRMEKSMRESWWYLKSQLSSLKAKTVPSDKLDSFLTDTLESIKNQHQLMRTWYDDVNSVSSSDSATQQLNWRYWQRNVSTELQTLMQKRLHHLQNPQNCDSARKVVCQVGGIYGFGSLMHHIGYCFIMAYASKRTLVLESKDWAYNRKGGWDAVFQPVTPCRGASGDRKEWTQTSNENTVALDPNMNFLGSFDSPRPSQQPMSVPKDIVDRLTSFHGFPFAWFASQFMHYLLRPSPALDTYLKNKEERLGLSSMKGPIVGVQVRRTDKRDESPYYNLSEYMQQVEEWYERYDLVHSESKVKRRVFIATDEPSVLEEAKTQYPQYEVLSNSEITSLASKIDTRFSEESLFGVVFDLNVLSKCDYIVCTFSSNMCRLAYVLMQKFHVDASNMYYSLDWVWFLHGQHKHHVQAIQDHQAPADRADKELSFSVGERFKIDYTVDGNELNGYTVGTSVKTNKRGLIPSHKIEEEILVADFPTYNEVK